MKPACSPGRVLFLSTPSARRATTQLVKKVAFWIFLSTPSARRATLSPRRAAAPTGISIHALREEGDHTPSSSLLSGSIFLSTPSARRATLTKPYTRSIIDAISIHALREEGDQCIKCRVRRLWHFYPRPPRGGRQGRRYDLVPTIQFLSTPSARRATSGVEAGQPQGSISIHALREEGDGRQLDDAGQLVQFLSTPSARRATVPLPLPGPSRNHFYPRPPRGGRHRLHSGRSSASTFLSTPSARRATYRAALALDADQFLSTPSARRAT